MDCPFLIAPSVFSNVYFHRGIFNVHPGLHPMISVANTSVEYTMFLCCSLNQTYEQAQEWKLANFGLQIKTFGRIH